MDANLYYNLNGESWTALDFCSKISFSTKRGLIRAINNKIRKDLENGNLRRFFGSGIKVNVNVYCKQLIKEQPIATTSVLVY